MKILSKTLRVIALTLALMSVLCTGLPVLADAKDQGNMQFNLSVNKEQTFDLVIASPNVAVSSINISKSSNCGILSTLKGSCVSRGDNKVFTLTVKAVSGGTATFDYTYSYNYNGSEYSYVTHVTLNVTGPTPEPAMPVVSITAGPQNAQTGACTLTANLSGCKKYNYEWYVNTANSTSGGTLLDSGTTTGSTITHDCTFKSTKTADYYYFYVVVSNAETGGKGVASKVVQLVNPYSPTYNTPTPAPAKNLPVITKHPSGEVVEAGDSASFIAKADKADSVVWYFTDGETTFKASKAANYIKNISVSGYNANTLKLSNIPLAANGYAVYAEFTNKYGSIESDRAYIYVGADIPAVSLTASEQDSSDGSCTLTAKFSGCSKYAYEWYVNTTNSTSGASLLKSGTTTSKSVSREQTFKSTKTEPYYYVYIKVWNANASADEAVYSSAIKLLNPYSRLNPVITKHPTGESVSSGSSTSFIAHADDYDTVTWYFTNGSDTIKASKASSRFSGLKVSGYSEEKLKLSKIPSSLDGWSVFATFENGDGKIDTNKAKIRVDSSADDDDDDDYNYSYTRPTAVPTLTPYSITPVPLMPTPSPTPTPHIHNYPNVYTSDTTYHWHECECGDQGDIGVHTFTYYNSSTSKNTRIGVCSICGYMTEESTAAAPTSGSSLFTKLMIFLGILFVGAIGVLVYVLIKEKQRKERARKAAAARKRQERRRQNAAKAAAAKKAPPASYPYDEDFSSEFGNDEPDYFEEENDPVDDEDDDDDDFGPFNLFDN